MMKKITFILGALALSSNADLASDMLHAHNEVRGSLGIPDLSWADDLAQSSQRYAEKLAASDTLVHSHTDGVGENLAGGTAGSYTPTRLFQLWIDEEVNFIPGRNYPECQTGNGKVGHYTQVVWEKTTEVGCGFAVGPRKAKLVCQYRRPGNVRGQPVYTGNGRSSSHSNNVEPNDNKHTEENNNSNNNSDNNDNRYDNYNDNSNRYDDNNNREDSNDNSYNNNDNYNYNSNNNNNNGGGGGSQGGRNGGGGGSQGGRNGGGGGRI